ncbi:16S rRNA (guanine(966)-N(2))-methyltransferase RsmD [Collinsella ihumii]|uniref:16S rRNA (Guanine(966)-N(2))-methyltransferase RsmD n=1 Tax=Collinsella ihumii TaxID=1720204 RepID=A0ABT7XFW9_9ACTN|nr:16S rRNA (guanine(966)-N(2))-methyltransferase RsmD [Collinsella ihumii]MDN0064082.1 16S rRNA (guanine(966)-N(2))-methyltransferase RsmD [Collinsella ihumii]
MRIVSGEWRGRKLSEPQGRDVTRPTTDRVREACVSMAESALDDGIEGARVLDAFAGSGALGIEMLSRGAAFAAFFDIDRGAAALVRKNLESLRCGRERYRVTCGDVLAHAGRGRISGGPFDLVVIDAPYALGADPAVRLLDALADAGMLAPRAVALCEHAASDEGPRPDRFEAEREKRYGITAVDLLRFQG